MKKISILLLAIVMVFGSVYMAAADTTDSGTAKPTICIDEVINTAPGENFQVNIYLENTTYFAALNAEIVYDKDAMTYLSATAAQDLRAPLRFEPSSSSEAISAVRFVCTSMTNISFNGKIATLNFKMNENYQPGAEIPITIRFYKGHQGTWVNGIDANFYFEDDRVVSMGLAYGNDATGEIGMDGIIKVEEPIDPTPTATTDPTPTATTGPNPTDTPVDPNPTDTPVDPQPTDIPENSGIAVTVGDAEGEKGDTVQIPVSISGNTGFVNLGLELKYNRNVMTLVSAEYNAELEAYYAEADLKTIPFPMTWDNISGTNVDFNGNLMMLEFRIHDNAEPGTYNLEIDCYKGDGTLVDGDDINYDENDKNLNLEYSNGAVVVKETGGDQPKVNGLEIIDESTDTKTKCHIRISSADSKFDGSIVCTLYSSKNTPGRLDDRMQASWIGNATAAGADVEFDFVKSEGYYLRVFWFDENMRPKCEDVELHF